MGDKLPMTPTDALAHRVNVLESVLYKLLERLHAEPATHTDYNSLRRELNGE